MSQCQVGLRLDLEESNLKMQIFILVWLIIMILVGILGSGLHLAEMDAFDPY
jgi:hypothetical protein